MPVKHVAHRKQMAKKFMKKQAVGWTASTLTETDLAKAREEGFLVATAEVILPGSEVVPHSQPGFRVMFLAFLLHGISLPAHEFLRGLLFVYGV
jgi:hypothetical protein